jgi:glycosyltransferase involved in cell wall biosynthesis
MNILIISKIDISKPTGETEHFLGLAKGFVKLKHNITIIVPIPESRIISNEMNIISIKCTNNPYLRSLIFQFKMIFLLPLFYFKNKIDFTYVRQGPFFLIPSLIAKIMNRKIISEINGLMQDDLELLYNPPEFILLLSKFCEKLSYILSNTIISVTPELKYFISKRYNIKECKISIISNGVDTNFYHIEKKRHSTFNVLFMGNTSKWQGINILLNSISMINKKLRNAHFILVTNKKVHFYNKNTISYINLNKNDILKLLPVIDISIAPYTRARNKKSGISPIKVFTYLSSGIPVVISNIGGISKEIKKQKAGVTFEPDNPEDLSKIIIDIYKQRDKLLPLMSGNARKLAKQYDWEIIASKIIDFVYN